MERDELITKLTELGYEAEWNAYDRSVDVKGPPPTFCPICGNELVEYEELDGMQNGVDILRICENHGEAIAWFVRSASLPSR